MIDSADISGGGLETVRHLVHEGYIPFTEEERVIPWPTDETRWENDAEHSHSLAFVGAALGAEFGLDTGKIALYATYHDFVERYAGDTSVWDDAGQATKESREAAALAMIEQNFGATPEIAQLIHSYESLEDEEARFVYALDKLLAVVMIVEGKGRFWRENAITYGMHMQRVEQVRSKIQKHPLVAQWYEELLDIAAQDKGTYFSYESYEQMRLFSS